MNVINANIVEKSEYIIQMLHHIPGFEENVSQEKN